jgi:hypothetical protein
MSAWPIESRGPVEISHFKSGLFQDSHARRPGNKATNPYCKSVDVLCEPCDQILCFFFYD